MAHQLRSPNLRFVEAGGQTRVELEHRNIERHGEGAQEMHRQVGADEGWAQLIGTPEPGSSRNPMAGTGSRSPWPSAGPAGSVFLSIVIDKMYK